MLVEYEQRIIEEQQKLIMIKKDVQTSHDRSNYFENALEQIRQDLLKIKISSQEEEGDLALSPSIKTVELVNKQPETPLFDATDSSNEQEPDLPPLSTKPKLEKKDIVLKDDKIEDVKEPDLHPLSTKPKLEKEDNVFTDDNTEDVKEPDLPPFSTKPKLEKKDNVFTDDIIEDAKEPDLPPLSTKPKLEKKDNVFTDDIIEENIQTFKDAFPEIETDAVIQTKSFDFDQHADSFEKCFPEIQMYVCFNLKDGKMKS